MEAVVVQIKNHQALNFFKNLEDLNVIKVLRRVPYSQVEMLMNNEHNKDSIKRLTEIQAITKNIHVDLAGFHFNRNEANNYGG
ncbi:MAG: hypothetical protein LBG31_01205 [Prevotellaceae bacterium]|jgi:hypothetical protein|nr:hypothetical protein [Prevotellaceae bacterium]